MGPCRSPEANPSAHTRAGEAQMEAQRCVQNIEETDAADARSDASASWLVDTGASFHIVNEQTAKLRNYQTMEEPIILQTANGTQKTQQTASVDIPQLGARRCYTMPGSPNLLSLGELIQTEGCRFRWGPETGPELWDKNGRKLGVQVTNNLPVISTASPAEINKLKEFVEAIRGVFECVATQKQNSPTLPTGVSIRDIPVDHLITHVPMRRDCEGCLRGKLTKAPARRQKERIEASTYLERLHIDIIGPVAEDLAGNKYIMVIKDEYTKWAATTPTKTREAAVMKRCLLDCHLGNPKFATNITCDGDCSFQGEFAELCREKQCRIHRTVPYRSTSNSIAERFNRMVNEGVRTAMATANAPYAFWGFAVQHWNVNYNHSATTVPEAPFERKCGRKSAQRLVPFGCECYYVATRHRKFADKGRRDVIIGYTILDWSKWANPNLADISTTKGVTISATTFPWRVRSVGDRNGHGGQPETQANRIAGHSDHRREHSESEQELGRRNGTNDGSRGSSDSMGDGNWEIEGVEPIPMFEGAEVNIRDNGSDQVSDGSGSDEVESQNGEAEREHEPAKDIVTENTGASEENSGADGGNTTEDGAQERLDNEVPPDENVQKRTRKRGSLDTLLQHLERIKKTKNSPQQNNEDEERTKRSRGEHMDKLAERDATKRAKMSHEEVCAALFGNVARPVKLSSEEGKSEEAIKAIKKEDDNHMKKGTWDYNEVEEWNKVRDMIPGAEIVRAHLILVEKNSEDPNQAHRKLKARLVARGDDVRTANGQRAVEEDLFGSPISLCASGVIDVYAGLIGGVTEVADVDGAYLQAPLKGAPKYIELPVQMWPKGWDGKYQRPVCRLHKALYGLQRAGFDWMEYASENLKTEKWTQLKDAEKHVYKRKCKNGDVLLGLYVDDCKLAAREDDLEEAWTSIQRCFKLGDKPERTENMA